MANSPYQRQAEVTALLGTRLKSDVIGVEKDPTKGHLQIEFRDNRDGTRATIAVADQPGCKNSDRAVLTQAREALQTARADAQVVHHVRGL